MADALPLYGEIEALIADVTDEAADRISRWATWEIRAPFTGSAQNLAAYLALRHHDLRGLQRSLMALGLSSLGRLEGRVLPTLESVRAALASLANLPRPAAPDEATFFAGETLLNARSSELFGPCASGRAVALLVTCPSEAADDPAFMNALADHGIEAIRINCAHDDVAQWRRMIDHAQGAGIRTGRPMKIFMDLAGPKVRTGKVHKRHGEKRVMRDDRIAVVMPGGLDDPLARSAEFAVECAIPEAISAVRIGHRLFIDDGKIAAVIEQVEPSLFVARVTRSHEDGVKLKPEKGLNFPDTHLAIPALTAKDIDDLAFVAHHADAIGYSFVQSPDDVALLQEAIARHRPDDWQTIALMLKIETTKAVSNLPDIVVRAGARQPVAIMIARGDLAMEIGFPRLAEMQEEILWIGEAAQVPVIWATQVLEGFVKTGLPSRGEMTDAAMAARAECVMLNKGPYLLDAITTLKALLGRMDDHVHKKTPQLRRLQSW